jgi:pimeloyl-ACP methyl ester carboxylesterase
MKVLIDGQLVEYKKEGAGRAVLLLHGWGASLGTFDQLTAHLVKTGHLVYRFDFPGFGASPVPARAWSVGDYAILTAAFIEKLKIKQLSVLFGHSFGGRVIIKATATGIIDPEKIVLMGAAGIKPPTTFRTHAYAAVAKVGKAATALPGMSQVRETLRSALYRSAGSSDYLQAGAMKATFVKTINEDLTGYLPLITTPTLLVWGEHDTETPLAYGQRMQKELRQAELAIVPGAGHFVYTDDSTTTFAAIDRFVQ